MSYTLKTVTFRAAEPQSPVLEGPADAARILLDVLEELDQDREHFMVLALNARGRVIGYKVIATGTANACLVHPREVFRTAIALGAVTVIVAHNHPSGEAGSGSSRAGSSLGSRWWTRSSSPRPEAAGRSCSS